VSEHFKEQLSAITEVVDAVLLLTTLAPGGVLTEAEKSEYERRLTAAQEGKYQDVLIQVKSAIQDWSSSQVISLASAIARTELGLTVTAICVRSPFRQAL
jgi:hypothetical protein